MSFGLQLKDLITRHNISQSTFADKIGITRSRLNNYISDRSEPDFEMLKIMAQYFNISVDVLLNRKDYTGILDTKAFAPEIVAGADAPLSGDESMKWVPIYLSISTLDAKDEYSIPVPLGWLKTKKNSLESVGFNHPYALLMNDDSMSPELLRGDIAYVQPSFFLHSIASPSHFYAIRLYHSDPMGLALRKCIIMDNVILCVAENSKYAPIIFNMERTIFEPFAGRVSGVWRSMYPQNIINTLLG